MSIQLMQGNQASEAQAISEISAQGFAAAAKDYGPGRTEPHRHTYDICLHILEGEFRLGLPDDGVVRGFGPGERLLVPAGTPHFEEHGPLRMVVGRREPRDVPASTAAAGA